MQVSPAGKVVDFWIFRLAVVHQLLNSSLCKNYTKFLFGYMFGKYTQIKRLVNSLVIVTCTLDQNVTE